LTFYQKLKSLFIQFFKYGIIGGVNTLAFLAINYGLLFLGVHYILAYAVAFVVTVFSAFFFNRKFVFKPDEGKSKVKQLVKVFTVYLTTLFLGMGLLFLQVEIIGISDIVAPVLNLFFTSSQMEIIGTSEVIAPVLNLFVTIPLNFILNKYWAFR